MRQVREGLRVLCKLLNKKEVHYQMLSSGVWLPAKPLLSSLQLRAFEASHQWVCLNCSGMRPRSPADVSAAGSAAGQGLGLTARGRGLRGTDSAGRGLGGSDTRAGPLRFVVLKRCISPLSHPPPPPPPAP